MTVSAIVPVHNGRRFIAEALASITAQSMPVLETIVVDDGSSDGSADLARQECPSARIICQPRAGAALARNRGADAANGTWLAFLDHDDVWPSDRTKVLLDAAALHPNAGLIVGRFEADPMPGATLDARVAQASGTHVPFLLPACLVRRSVWLALGGMDPARERSEDLDLYMRLRDCGHEIVNVDTVTLRYRFHGQNRSRTVDLSNAALLETLYAAVKRRRPQ